MPLTLAHNSSTIVCYQFDLSLNRFLTTLNIFACTIFFLLLSDFILLPYTDTHTHMSVRSIDWTFDKILRSMTKRQKEEQRKEEREQQMTNGFSQPNKLLRLTNVSKLRRKIRI